MNAIHEGILLLIKSAVTGERYVLPGAFSMEEALDVIKRHNIVSLAYDGAVRCGVSKDIPVMQQLFREYCRILMYSEGQMRAIGGICRAFDENGIDYMPLKGCNLKHMYPKPELRQMGDADILIRKGQYGLIRPVMKDMGFEEVMESDHELVWKRKDLYLELHKHLIPSYNKDYYAYFGDGWRLAKKAEGTKYILNPEDEFIFIFTHFAKHYRDGGIGIRHVLDLWVYRQKHPGMEEAYIRKELEKLRLYEFYLNISQVINTWFSAGNHTDKTEFISGFIFDSGSWGKWQNHAFSAIVKNTGVDGSVQQGRFYTAVRMVFPSAKMISDKYHILEKAPVFLPFCWIVRWIDAVLFRPEIIRRRNREYKIATAEESASYHESLRYVGLDFNFKVQKENGEA